MSWQESNELQTIDQMVTKSMTENNQNNADDIDIGSDYSYFNLGHEWWCALKWFDLTLHKDSHGNALNVPVWRHHSLVPVVSPVWERRGGTGGGVVTHLLAPDINISEVFRAKIIARHGTSSKYDRWAWIKSVRSCCHAGLVTMWAWWDHDTPDLIQLWPPHKLLTGQARGQA